MMRRRLLLLVLPALLCCPWSARADFALNDDDRVLFFGDTLVFAQGFSSYVETFIHAKYPDLKARFFNYGQPRFFLTVPPGDPAAARAHFDELVAGNFVLADRFRAAEVTLKTRRWELDRAHWDAVGKPALLARTAALLFELFFSGLRSQGAA